MRNPFWDGRGPLFGDNRMVNTWHLHLFGKPRQRRTWSSIVVDINMTAYDLYRDYDSSSWGTRNNDCWSFGRLLWGHFNDKTLACVFINFYFCVCVCILLYQPHVNRIRMEEKGKNAGVRVCFTMLQTFIWLEYANRRPTCSTTLLISPCRPWIDATCNNISNQWTVVILSSRSGLGNRKKRIHHRYELCTS